MRRFICRILGLAVLMPLGVLAQSPDRILMGSMTLANFNLISSIPLPAFPNQKFCSLIQLAPNVLTWAYVPTALERNGNYSAFPTPLPDPLSTGSFFPGNIIPVSRLPGTFGWRIPFSGPSSSEVCVPVPGNYPVFISAYYVSGLTAGVDVVNPSPSVIGFSYRLGDPLPNPQILTVTAPGAQLSYMLSVQSGFFMNGQFQSAIPPWLSYSGCGCHVPGTPEPVNILPSGLVPGTYIAQMRLVAIGAIASPQTVTVNVLITAPADYLVVSTKSVAFQPYVLTNADAIPPPVSFSVVSLGIASSYTTRVTYVTPPGAPWFFYSPPQDNKPGVITVTLNPSLKTQVGRGNFLGYIDVFAGNSPSGGPGLKPAAAAAAPNSPQRVVVSLQVFPDPDFTVTPDSLLFSYPSDSTASQSIHLDPVNAPVFDLGPLSFNVRVTNMDAQDADWLTVAPAPTAVPGRLIATLNPAGVQSLSSGAVHQALITFNTGSNNEVSTGRTVAAAVQIPPGPVINAPAVNSVLSAGAGGGAGLTPGSWIAIYGQNLAQGMRELMPADVVAGALPVSLNGVDVRINGRAAALSFVSPTQINALVPDDATRGPVPIVVTNAGVRSAVFTTNLTDSTPAFFPFAGNHVAAQHANFSLVGVSPYAPNGTPARPGETIALYGTGFGPTGPPTPAGVIVTTAYRLVNAVSVSIGGKSAFVPFAGVTGAGLTQINVTVPDVPDGDQTVIATVNGVSSPATLLAVRR